MDRSELAEWIVMLLVIVMWWPPLLFGWGPDWYRYPLYVVSIVTLSYILARRWRRMQEGLRHSQQMLDAQRMRDAGVGPPVPGAPSVPRVENNDESDDQG